VGGDRYESGSVDAALIRTSLVARAKPLDPSSAWVADALRRGEQVRLFADVLRSPISVDDLAAALWEMAALPRQERTGPWHVTGPEVVTRYTLGVLIAAHSGSTPPASPRCVALTSANHRRVTCASPRPAPTPYCESVRGRSRRCCHLRKRDTQGAG
jgi:dTDP-4-dehydrorhamnose reductase